MITWIFYTVVLAILVIIFSIIFGRFLGRGENSLGELEEVQDEQTRQARMEANALAVVEGRFDDITLDVALRGYRQDEVDALIGQLQSIIEGEKNS